MGSANYVQEGSIDMYGHYIGKLHRKHCEISMVFLTRHIHLQHMLHKQRTAKVTLCRKYGAYCATLKPAIRLYVITYILKITPVKCFPSLLTLHCRLDHNFRWTKPPKKNSPFRAENNLQGTQTYIQTQNKCVQQYTCTHYSTQCV